MAQDVARRRPDVPAAEPDTTTTGTTTTRRLLLAVRPLLFAVASGCVVLGLYAAAILGSAHARSPRTEYGLHVAALVVAVVAVAAVWWARRRGQTWDADLLPALFGGLAAFTMLMALHATPFDLRGIGGDQSFRTAAVTRFADGWTGDDYTYRDHPFYYAPGFFFLLGRAADLFAVPPWMMLKVGAILVAFATPLVSYLFWRRLVTPRVAALISAVPLILPDLTEPYGWLVQVAMVPWWLDAIHDVRRRGVRPHHPLVAGLIGGLIFVVYYYYFFVFPIVFVIWHALAWWRGEFSWRAVRRGLAVLAVAAAVAAAFWARLAWDFLTAEQFHSLNNRWMTWHSGDLALPMLAPTIVGALCLTGLVYLVWTAREPLSRALLIVTASLYVWHAVGYLLAVVDRPVMAFRMKTLVPLVLVSAAAFALVRLVGYAVRRLPADRVWRVAAVGALGLAIFATDHFVTAVVDDPLTRAAHNQTLPDGTLPPFHDPDAEPVTPSTDAIRDAIEATYAGDGNATVWSDRPDLYAFYPYYGFVQWNANYSHPTARYHDRLDFLEDSAAVATPAKFARRIADNPYDRIDAIVLRVDGDQLRYVTYDDAFPWGTDRRELLVPTRLIDEEHFVLTRLDDYLVAVRRTA
ncbi:arabinofuranosyltransferase [Solwaraspora sp. WMMD406]|uniref:arabinofuranosyltransferase n=1 Tax=Solwaraspora sp. WMMD406 TaxID=3016095 RepID=UPI0024179347|nr:arabinofuranosyltransferase [Solwaraspora sp. WMMD406]MDG4766880.1 arabinofuranosyltransferase [Solwaraspora sp. WMMD406]